MTRASLNVYDPSGIGQRVATAVTGVEVPVLRHGDRQTERAARIGTPALQARR